ncbi:MAG TPA: hypothetical protein VN027_16645, partial [Isoptericola sp.]|nr:hypothetical protein [Isoptericola sp.]
ALGVPPLRLLYNLREGAEPAETLPGVPRLPMAAVDWFTGEHTELKDDPVFVLARHEARMRGMLRAYIGTRRDAVRQGTAREAGLTPHAPDPGPLVAAAQEMIDDTSAALRKDRREMMARGITPPPIDDDLREAYEAAGGDDDGA